MQLKIEKFFFTKSAYSGFFSILVQQIIVASSVYFLTQAMGAYNLNNKTGAFLFLLGYFCSLALPFIPGAMALCFFKKWQLDIIQKTTQNYSNEFKGQVLIWLNKKSKEDIVSTMSSDLFITVERVTGSIYSFTSTALNVGLSILSLALFVDIRLLPVYIISLLLSYLMFKKTSKIVSGYALEVQSKRNSFAEILRRSWDALLINNSLNERAWDASCKNRLSALTRAETLAEKAKQLVNVSLSFVSFLPVIFYSAYSFYSNIDVAGKSLALMVNLPRLFMLMNHTYALLCESVEYNATRELWRALLNRIAPSQQVNLNTFDKIKEDQIRVYGPGGELGSIAKFSLQFDSAKVGRYTLRGPNGAGKSLSLAKLKMQWGESAFLMPANHDLFCTEDDTLSSGQRAKQGILWLKQNLQSDRDVKVILLDEWDANLDPIAQAQVDVAIQELSAEFLMIEVRHSKGK